MQKKHELPSEYKTKLFLIDTITVDDTTTATVYVYNNKRSIRRYCRDVEIPFIEGLKKLYEEGIELIDDN